MFTFACNILAADISIQHIAAPHELNDTQLTAMLSENLELYEKEISLFTANKIHEKILELTIDLNNPRHLLAFIISFCVWNIDNVLLLNTHALKEALKKDFTKAFDAADYADKNTTLRIYNSLPKRINNDQFSHYKRLDQRYRAAFIGKNFTNAYHAALKSISEDENLNDISKNDILDMINIKACIQAEQNNCAKTCMEPILILLERIIVRVKRAEATIDAE